MAREQKPRGSGGAAAASTHRRQPAARRRASMTDSATLEEQCHQKKVFVGGLNAQSTTQMLCDYFKKYGAIVDAVVLRWPDGRSRGFGYVTFADLAAATAVLEVAHRLAGCEVDVKRAVPGTHKLFVGGLPQNTSAAEMRTHFEQFGIVSDAVVMIDPATNRSRGFGFICFSPGQDGAAAVATALQQYDAHYLRGKWIEVKSAAPPRKLVGGDGQVEAPPAKLAVASEALAGEAPALEAGARTSPAAPPASSLAPPPGLEYAPLGASAAHGGPPWPQHAAFPPTAAAALPSLLGAGARGALPSLLSTGHANQFRMPGEHGAKVPKDGRPAAKAATSGPRLDHASRTLQSLGLVSMEPVGGDVASATAAGDGEAPSEVFRLQMGGFEEMLRLQMGAR